MKKTKNKRKSLLEAEKQMELLLKRVGYTGKYKGETPYDIPNYRTEFAGPKTSDEIPCKTPKKLEKKYTGTELLGIAQTHKSNAIPIRKDNKQSAIDAAQMRRN